ncbi:mucin-17-like [Homarus americanus]|uniref:mucin-17-like n=1 Tax=Homarus americanus TaxID=6706 RepID=UPI001C488192|nr:mucin-17-like [Homarus americanus]
MQKENMATVKLVKQWWLGFSPTVPILNSAPSPTVPILNSAPSSTVPILNSAPSSTVPILNSAPSSTVPILNSAPSSTVPTLNSVPSSTVPVLKSTPYREVIRLHKSQSHNSLHIDPLISLPTPIIFHIGPLISLPAPISPLNRPTGGNIGTTQLKPLTEDTNPQQPGLLITSTAHSFSTLDASDISKLDKLKSVISTTDSSHMGDTHNLKPDINTTNAQTMGDKDKLKADINIYSSSVMPSVEMDSMMNTAGKIPSNWPFTMKPVQVILKTQTYADISSPKPSLHNDTKESSDHMTENTRKLFVEKNVNESSDLVSVNISLGSSPVCCEDNLQKHAPNEGFHIVTEKVTTSELPLSLPEDNGTNSADNSPQYNQEMFLSHENTTKTLYPSEKIDTLLPSSDTETDFLSTGKDNATSPDSSFVLHGEGNIPLLTKVSHTNSSPKINKSVTLQFRESDTVLPTHNDTLSPENDTTSIPLLQGNDPPQPSDNTAPLPVEETAPTSLVQNKNEPLQPSETVNVSTKHVKLVKVISRSQIEMDHNKSQSSHRVPVKISSPHQWEEGRKGIPMQITNQPYRVNGHPNHPLQDRIKPQRLLVPWPTPPRRSFRPGYIKNQHLNVPPPPKMLSTHNNSSEGILPQFNPTSGLQFKLSKLKETKSEPNIKDVLPQFSPTSGKVFTLTQSANDSSKINNDISEAATPNSQPDSVHMVNGPSLGNHLHNKTKNPEVTTKAIMIHNKESVRLPLGYDENEFNSSLSHKANDYMIRSDDTDDYQVSFGTKEQVTTSVSHRNNFNNVTNSTSDTDATASPNIYNEPLTPPTGLTSTQSATYKPAEVADEITKTSASITIEDNPTVIINGNFSFTNTKPIVKSVRQREENQSVVLEKKDDNYDSQILPLREIEPSKVVSFDSTIIEEEIEPDNLSKIQTDSQNFEELKENTSVHSLVALFQNTVPSKIRASSNERNDSVLKITSIQDSLQVPIMTQSTPPSQLTKEFHQDQQTAFKRYFFVIKTTGIFSICKTTKCVTTIYT